MLNKEYLEKLSKAELLAIIQKNLSAIPESEIKTVQTDSIPLSVFDNKELSSLETICKYLKENQNVDGGFGYTKEYNRNSYGSMTLAGLICQMITQMDLSSVPVKNTLNWISQNYALEKNPKADSEKHYPYYLNKLATGLHLSGLDSITDDKGNVHFWYKEIVEKLLKEQKPDGTWEAKWYEPILCTEFYIMILQLKQLEEKVIDIF